VRIHQILTQKEVVEYVTKHGKTINERFLKVLSEGNTITLAGLTITKLGDSRFDIQEGYVPDLSDLVMDKED